jgi:hypothetical protein
MFPHRNPHVGELHLGGTVGHPEEAEHGKGPDHVHARGVLGDEDHRLLAVAIRVVRVGLAHEDDDVAARMGGVRRVPLPSVDDVLVAVTNDGALDVRGVTRRDGRPAVLIAVMINHFV